MPTKRSTTKTAAPAQSAAHQTVAEQPHSPHGGPTGATARHAPAEISQTHQLICDAVAELLTHGGHKDDVDSLLYAAMAHVRRRTFSAITDDAAQVDNLATAFISKNLDEWKTDLAISWRKNKHPDRAEIEAKTITELIRANTREQLFGAFEDFMSSASVEEQVLMLNVLNGCEGRHLPAEMKMNENCLATAFALEIDRDDAFVKVPESMVKSVQKYADALRAIKSKAA